MDKETKQIIGMDSEGGIPTDIVGVLEYKADILKDQYRSIKDGRAILTAAAEEIKDLRNRIDNLEAEVVRLNGVAQY